MQINNDSSEINFVQQPNYYWLDNCYIKGVLMIKIRTLKLIMQ